MLGKNKTLITAWMCALGLIPLGCARGFSTSELPAEVLQKAVDTEADEAQADGVATQPATSPNSSDDNEMLAGMAGIMMEPKMVPTRDAAAVPPPPSGTDGSEGDEMPADATSSAMPPNPGPEPDSGAVTKAPNEPTESEGVESPTETEKPTQTVDPLMVLNSETTDRDDPDAMAPAPLSPYSRRGDAEGGAVRSTATLFLSANRIVTATVGATSGHLKLIVWNLVGDQGIVRSGEISAGAAKTVVLGQPEPNHILAAVQQQDDRLKMIAYRVDSNGAITRVDDYTAGTISDLDMTTTSHDDPRAVTAVRDGSDELKLIAWDIEASNRKVEIVRLGDVSAEAASAVRIAAADNFPGVIAAVRDGNDELKLIPWQLSDDGLTLTRKEGATAGLVDADLDVAPLPHGVAAAVRDSQGNLRIITWSVDNAGDIGSRMDTAVAGVATEINLLPSPSHDSSLTTVVCGEDQRMYIIGWSANADGGNLRRLGSSRTGKASQISADITALSAPGGNPEERLITTVRDGGGDLKLISWDATLSIL